MAVTSTDIANRALQLIGTRTNIASLAESSNEAIQANISYLPVRDWCLGAVNWNFARRTVKQAVAKSLALPPPAPWSTASPSPPWLYEYALPADVLKIQYVTNSTANAANTAYRGEPQRFVVAIDILGGVEQRVLLTNEASAVIIYTGIVVDPTEWPWMFERFMVSSLALTLSMALTGDKELTKYLDDVAMRYFSIALEANNTEGLSFNDTTPEWIQALGINYPLRRTLHKPSSEPPRGKN